MYLRNAYLELYDHEDGEKIAYQFETYLQHAAERRHAWFTGFFLGMDMDQAILYAEEYGYSLWAPEITANGVTRRVNNFVGVRNDLVSGELEKYFELGRLGFGQTDSSEKESFGDPNGFVSVSFQASAPGLNRVSVGCAPYLYDHLTPVVENWQHENSQETDIAFFGTYHNAVPLFRSAAGLVTGLTASTQVFGLTGHHVYVESTYTVRKI